MSGATPLLPIYAFMKYTANHFILFYLEFIWGLFKDSATNEDYIISNEHDVLGCRHTLICDSIVEFACRDWGNRWSLRILGVLADIRTWHLRTTSLNNYILSQLQDNNLLGGGSDWHFQIFTQLLLTLHRQRLFRPIHCKYYKIAHNVNMIHWVNNTDM
jgi:hypothetical protein